MMMGRSEQDIVETMALRGGSSMPIDDFDVPDDSAPRWDIPDDLVTGGIQLESAHASPAPNLPFAGQRLGWDDDDAEAMQSRSRLPEGWTEYLDETTGRCFYHNEAAKRTQWEWPDGPLPPLEGSVGKPEGMSPSESVLIAAGDLAQSPFNNVGDLSGFLERDFEPEVSPVEEGRHGPVTSPGPLDLYDAPSKEEAEPGWCASIMYHIVCFFVIWFGPALFDQDGDGDFDVHDAQCMVVDLLGIFTPKHVRASRPRQPPKFGDYVRGIQAKKSLDGNPEQVINTGTVLTVTEEAVVFASVVTWDRMCTVERGQSLSAIGPPLEGEGYMMVPVKTDYGDGAISLHSVVLSRTPPPPPPPLESGRSSGTSSRNGKDTPLGSKSLGGGSPVSSRSLGTMGSRIEAKARIWRTKFECHPGQNTFKEQDTLTCVADDLDLCKGLCLEKGYGAFVVWRKYAYFKTKSTPECRKNLIFDREATTYLNLELDPTSPITPATNEQEEVNLLVDTMLDQTSRGNVDGTKKYLHSMAQKKGEQNKLALALMDPRLQGVFKLDRNGDGEVDLTDLLESQIKGVGEEALVAKKLKSGKFFPWFVFFQCLIPGMAWAVEALRHNMDLSTAKAGLDSLFPGRTDLRLYYDCEDYRWQIWRWWTYQYSHIGIQHIGMNVFLTLMLGIPLEASNGHVFTSIMFQVGVFGGAACTFLTATRVATVGASGGVYSLFGIMLANLLLNWHHSVYRKPQLFFLISLVAVDTIVAHYGGSPEHTSHTAHIGGAIGGLFGGMVLGKIKDKQWWVKYFQGFITFVTFCILLVFLLLGLRWPPRDWIEDVPWCWSRQIWNRTFFNSSEWQCVRCADEECINQWAHQTWVADVNTYFCMQLGWSDIGPSKLIGL